MLGKTKRKKMLDIRCRALQRAFWKQDGKKEKGHEERNIRKGII